MGLTNSQTSTFSLSMKKFTPADIKAIRLSDSYLAPRQQAGYESTIPSSIAQCHQTKRLEAFKLDWKPGMPDQPHIFWDSDVAKVLEGMAYAVAQHPENTALADELDSYVDLIISAQQPDGYLNVHFTVVAPEHRWYNIYNWHELYCAGHLMEAAVAHFYATGKRKFLDAMCRYADYIASVFGREPGKKHGYPGHEEIELALCRLAEASGNHKYYDLAKYFIDERGQSPNYFIEEGKINGDCKNLDDAMNRQAHEPVRQQKDAVGHCVRALYLYTGMVDVAEEYHDDELLQAAIRLYHSTVNRRMYITGGVGSTPHGEAYTLDYDLQNCTQSAYAESCASMALVQLAKRLLNLTGKGEYADILEQALYNCALSGLSLKGDKFFYANPLEVDDNSYFNYHNIQPERVPWFDCSCCPTSYCRFLPQLGSFCWSQSGDDEYRLNIPVAGVADFGKAVFEVGGDYPNNGNIPVTVKRGGHFALSVRIPGWCRKYTITLNGEKVTEAIKDGYITISRDWQDGDVLQMTLDIPVDVVRANPKVTADAGKIALMHGPIVYALEGVDNGNNISFISIDTTKPFELAAIDGIPGALAIKCAAFRDKSSTDAPLYTRTATAAPEAITAVAIPYALWNNRGRCNMAVWLRAH